MATPSLFAYNYAALQMAADRAARETEATYVVRQSAVAVTGTVVHQITGQHDQIWRRVFLLDSGQYLT